MRKFLVVLLITCMSAIAFTACDSGTPAISDRDSYYVKNPYEEPQNTAAPTEEPQSTSEPVEDTEVIEDLTAVFDAALDYLVPEEELDAASMVSNAILNTTSYKIIAVENNMCELIVQYPNAANAFSEAFSQLSPEATDEEVDNILMDLAQKIENHEVEMIEKTFYPSLIEQDGLTNINWSYDIYDAFTGGFYSIEIAE